jgi:hypothetical protein
MQKREHRPRLCDDSTRRCDSQAGWDFRKGQDRRYGDAIMNLQAQIQIIPRDSSAWEELQGLLGDAYKNSSIQYQGNPDAALINSMVALEQAIDAYERKGFRLRRKEHL